MLAGAIACRSLEAFIALITHSTSPFCISTVLGLLAPYTHMQIISDDGHQTSTGAVCAVCVVDSFHLTDSRGCVHY